MLPFVPPLSPTLPKLTVLSVIDILIVAFLIYELIMIVRGTRAAHILAGILTVVVIYYSSIWLHLDLLHSILSTVMQPVMVLAVVVLFQSEIRRTLARIGRKRIFGRAFRRRESTEEILLAITRMAREKTGALIVLERDIGLRTFIESGVRLDAYISRDLLLSVFHKDTTLHDGAAIIQKDRLSAAACFLPLSMNPAISTKLGTRHRAAIGITEETDCLAIIVSEETGRISIAAFGEIESNLTPQEVGERIVKHFSDRHEWRAARRDPVELRAPETTQVQKISNL